MSLFPGLLSPMKRELLGRLQSEIENVTDAWLSTALKSLLLIQSRSDTHQCSLYLLHCEAAGSVFLLMADTCFVHCLQTLLCV